MKVVLRMLALSCFVVALSGCSMVGHWKLDTITPETAKAHFQMERLCLCQDGTYCTMVMEAGKEKCLMGKYTYDAGTKKLAFTTDGKERVYMAQFEAMGSKLKVWEEGKDWNAMMVKAECPKGAACCAKGTKSCGMKCGGDCGKCPGKDGKAAPMKDTKKADAKKAEPPKGESPKLRVKEKEDKPTTPANK